MSTPGRAVTETDPFDCPCGGWFEAGVTDDGGFVVHSLPPCSAFVDMEPADFVAYARKASEAGEVVS